MTVCPKCKTKNRPGARFCSACQTRLPASSARGTIELASDTVQINAPGAETRKLAHSRTDTQPLSSEPVFGPRPEGAIFGDNFLFDQLLSRNEDGNRHQYSVTQPGIPENLRYRECLNPTCGAVYWPQEHTPEQFCIDCGTPLSSDPPEMVLTETSAPLFDNVTDITVQRLSHGSVRAPLAAFVETVGGSERYCAVFPKINQLSGRPETSQILNWGAKLARGLEYLHQNGISFGGDATDRLGLAGGRPVWANFAGSTIHTEMPDQDRRADVRALAVQLFQWLTGKTQYELDPNLTLRVNSVMEQALSSPGFDTGLKLARSIEKALQEGAPPVAVDYRLGRCTHVGMERTLNEDSLLTIESSRIQKSISQPLGVYVVADGMGGHSAGEIASGMIVDTIAQKAAAILTQLTPTVGRDLLQWLREAVEGANQAVLDLRQSVGTDMGSTLVMAVMESNRAYIAHVGDSRAYLINTQGVQRLTTDHSLVERLIATNQITREEARNHPQRNVIYRTVGDKPNIEVETSSHQLAVGDRLLLCSDGLSGMIEDREIHQIVLESPHPQAACDALIAAANRAGGDDNVTAILVELVH